MHFAIEIDNPANKENVPIHIWSLGLKLTGHLVKKKKKK